MDADAFTLDDIAFPVAPANLDGFTIDDLDWVEFEVAAAGHSVCGIPELSPRVTAIAALTPRVAGRGQCRERMTATAKATICEE